MKNMGKKHQELPTIKAQIINSTKNESFVATKENKKDDDKKGESKKEDLPKVDSAK